MAFMLAKSRIRNMEIRYAKESSPRRQALLEMYVAIVLDTSYNDFETH